MFQVGQCINLTGGVARKGQLHVVRRDAIAVVADADQIEAAPGDFQPDVTRVGVQRVLD